VIKKVSEAMEKKLREKNKALIAEIRRIEETDSYRSLKDIMVEDYLRG
jgi:hypothetical protein